MSIQELLIDDLGRDKTISVDKIHITGNITEDDNGITRGFYFDNMPSGYGNMDYVGSSTLIGQHYKTAGINGDTAEKSSIVEDNYKFDFGNKDFYLINNINTNKLIINGGLNSQLLKANGDLLNISETGNINYTAISGNIGAHYQQSTLNGNSCIESNLSEDVSNFYFGNRDLKTINTITANSYKVVGGSNQYVLLSDGTTAPYYTGSGQSNFYLYQSQTNTTVPPSQNGHINYNNLVQQNTTIIYINHSTQDGVDIDYYLNQIIINDIIYIQDKNDSTNWIKYTILNKTQIQNQYTTLNVSFLDGEGLGLTSFGNNHPIFFTIYINQNLINQRLDAIENKTRYQSSNTINETTFINTLNTNVINANHIYKNGSGEYITDTEANLIYLKITDANLLYYTKTEINNNFVNNSTLNTTLLNYALNSTLSNYALNSTLLNYVLTSDLNTTLNNYVLTSALNSALNNYVLTTTLNSTLNNYALITTLNNYVLTSDLNTTLNNYVLTSALNSALSAYLQISVANGTYLKLLDASTTYATILSLSNYLTTSNASSTYATITSLNTISLTNTGTTSLISSTSANPSFKIKGLKSGTNITLNQVGEDIEINAMGGSSSSSGYSFNSIQNATTTLGSGTKSYWYICLINTPTTISGIQLYLSAGSDLFRVGIYRGYLKSAVSGSITLVGQSTDTTMVAGLPYMRKAITAISGQNLNFSTGEYMTIAFHSQGTSSVFYQSAPLSVGNTDLCYSSSANYASAGFPSTLTQSSILSTLLYRTCFELY